MPRLGLKNGFWERSFFERGVQVPRENKEYERSHKKYSKCKYRGQPYQEGRTHEKKYRHI